MQLEVNKIMPTSGEARIRPTSSYNLRSNPLPKTRRVAASGTSTNNKENIQHSAGKYKKSHIPVPVKTTPTAKVIKKPTNEDTKTGSASGKSKTRVRKVPDFAKLHRSWQNSFNKGKACTKKQCTQIREFDLTKPGAVFQPKYFNGNDEAPSEAHGEENVFQSDDEALQSILNSGLPDTSQKQGRPTDVGCGGIGVTQQKPSRQTLGALPCTFQGRTNTALNTRPLGSRQRQPAKPLKQNDPLEQEEHNGKSGRLLSLAEQQQENEINFETDAGALASILNNAGANFRCQAPTARQTIGAPVGAANNQGSLSSGRQSQGPLRTSIYYQRPRNMNFNRVYTNFANHILSRLSLAENMASSSNSKPLEQLITAGTTAPPQSSAKVMSKSHVMMSAPRRLETPRTASRVLNLRQQAAFRGQDTSSSPAFGAPPSALKKSNAHKSLSVKWADVLSPSNGGSAAVPRKDELATTLFADEDTEFLEPEFLSMNELAGTQGELQAASTMAKQDEIEQLEQQAAMHRNQLQEMDEIERQLELEIQKLQQDDYVPSPPTLNTEDHTEQDGHLDLEVASYPLQLTPKLTLEEAPFVDFSQSQHKQCFPPPNQDSVLTAGVGVKVERATETLDEPTGSVEGAITVQSTDAAFKHSPGSPFTTNGLSVVRNRGHQGSSAVQLQFHPGSEFQSHHGNGTCDSRIALSPERPHLIVNTPEKPFVEMGTHGVVTRTRNGDEGLHSRVLDIRKVQCNGQEPQLMIPKDGTRDKIEFKNPAPSDELNIQQHVASFSQIATQMQSGHFNPNRSNFVDEAPRLGTKASEQQLGLETDHKPQCHIGSVSSWMSSTPAHIQTPHAVKPHSMIKELALKQSLPSLNLPNNQHVSVRRAVPPIHTPLAMRSMSSWSQEGYSGASPVQCVSPTPLRFSQTLQSKHTQSIHNGSSPPSVGSDYPTPAANGTSVSELGKTYGNLSHQFGTLSYPASATTCLATPSEDSHKHELNSTSDQTPSYAASSSERDNSDPHLKEDSARMPSQLKFRGQGSLSLGAELLTSGGAATFLKSKMKPLLSATTNQLFQEALLDEECALYACRLPSKFCPYTPEERQCFDPVAKILMDGDDMHFVPIQSNSRVHIASPIGSAFNSYSNLAE